MPNALQVVRSCDRETYERPSLSMPTLRRTGSGMAIAACQAATRLRLLLPLGKHRHTILVYCMARYVVLDDRAEKKKLDKESSLDLGTGFDLRCSSRCSGPGEKQMAEVEID